MNILIINTAFDNADYIVVKGYEKENGSLMQIFSEKADSNAKHSETSLVFVDNALNDAGLKIGDIDVVAVNLGPGSFTGIRIGVALAKGFLCANENLRAIGLNSFEPILCRLYEKKNKLNNKCIIFDNLELKRIEELKAKTGNLSYNFDESKFIDMCGSGENGEASVESERPLDVYGKVCIPSGKADFYVCEVEGSRIDYGVLSDAEVSEGENCVIFDCDYRVSELVDCVIDKVNAGEFCSISKLEPIYLKLSQAEEELKKKQENKD